MPEGDALYRFARRVGEALEGRVIIGARAHGPGPVPQVHRLVGAICKRVASRGKNLLIEFDNGLLLRGHLRMYGTWHVYRPGERWSRPGAEARLVLETAESVVVNFSAPVIEMLETRALAVHAPVAKLGPDLLSDDFDPAEALRRLREPLRAEMTIGDAIMDQQVMAGVGNIWKHETLFRCGLYPWTRVRELDDATLLEVIETAQHLLRASVGKVNRWGFVRRPSMYVYQRAGQPCRRCGTTLQSRRQGIDIRFTTWCPRCQPAPAGYGRSGAVMHRPLRPRGTPQG